MKLFLSVVILTLFSICCTYPFEKATGKTSLSITVEGLNKYDSIVTRSELLNATGLIPECKDLRVIGFTYLFGYCELSERIIDGSEFSEKDKKYFSRIRPTSLHFYNIQAINDAVKILNKIHSA